MDSDELAREAVRMNRAIARCLHYLASELPEEKQGDFMLLLNDLQSKNMKVAEVLQHCTANRPDNEVLKKTRV